MLIFHQHRTVDHDSNSGGDEVSCVSVLGAIVQHNIRAFQFHSIAQDAAVGSVVAVLALAVTAAAMLGVDTYDGGNFAFRSFVTLVVAVQFAGTVVAGGYMLVRAAYGDAAGFFGTLVGALSGSSIATVDRVTGMVFAEAVCLCGESGNPCAEGQCQCQQKADTTAKKGFLHGVSSWR